ncbi:hypothetical protein QFZ24_000540 [Streptomyces phaeochromogenes]|nr:hypothetical protein [Streptomyces phaeochromogenes]
MAAGSPRACFEQRLRSPGRARKKFENIDAVVRGNRLAVRQAPRGRAGLTATHLRLAHPYRGSEVGLRLTRHVKERRHSRPHPLIQAHTHTAHNTDLDTLTIHHTHGELRAVTEWAARLNPCACG